MNDYVTCHIAATRRDLGSKCTQNAFAAGALPRTPLGELTALPQTPSCVWGAAKRQGRGGEGKGSGPSQLW